MVPSDPYRLSAIIQAHDYDVKALAFASEEKATTSRLVSCSRDAKVKAWSVTEANEAALLFDHHDHLHFVNAVALIGPTPTHPAGMIASGGADNMIRLVDVGSREAAAVLAGHTNNVCSLNWHEDRLISGSWDSSAIVWDPQTGAKVWNLLGHANAVWCTLVLDDDVFVTGSADKTIKVWRNDKCMKTLSGHTDCVRALQVLDRQRGIIASAGNDNTIRIWDIGTSKAEVIEAAHDAYIYSLALLENGMLASVGEDRCIKIWDCTTRPTKRCLQSIPVPATSIWTVVALNDGDMACGTNDGFIYLFSSEPGRQLFDEALLEVYEEKLRTATISKGTMESIDSSAVSNKDRLSQPGSKPGEHIIVESNGKVEAYQWDGQQWIKIGDVVDSKGSNVRQEYLGQQYDFVFDVQVEDSGASLKLPFNLSDNPYTAAQKFVSDNEMPPEYVDQVVDFILKNTEGQRPAASTGMFNPYLTSSAPSASTSAPAPAKTGPFYTEPVLLSSANLDGILKKISEFNGEQETPLNLKVIQSLVAFLNRDTSKAPEGIRAVFDILTCWAPDQQFPVLDLVRVAILNDRIAGEFLEFIQTVCLSPIPAIPSNPKVSQANVLMQMRLLTNTFQSRTLIHLLDPHLSKLIHTVRTLTLHPFPKDGTLPFQAILNLSLALGKRDDVEPEVMKSLIGLLLEKIRNLSTSAEIDNDSLKLLLSSVHALKGHLPKNYVKSLVTELQALQTVAPSSAPSIALLFAELSS